jgi:hypothetical protein
LAASLPGWPSCPKEDMDALVYDMMAFIFELARIVVES